MATLEPPSNDNNGEDKKPKWNFDYMPNLSEMTMEQQFQMRNYSDNMKNMSREQLYGVALDAMAMVFGIRNMTGEIARTHSIEGTTPECRKNVENLNQFQPPTL